MPVHIGDDVYDEIRGPYSFTLLRPIDEQDITFLFLGETHNFTNWEPCDGKAKCANSQTDFMTSLNKLAKHHPVEFYIEKFFDHPQDKVTLQHGEVQFFNRRSTLIKESVHGTREHKKGVYKHSFTGDVISPMTETAYMYRSCLYPLPLRVCELPNLKWNFVDARHENIFTYSSATSHAQHVYQETIKALYKYRRGEQGIDTPIEADLLTMDLKDDIEWEVDVQNGATVDVIRRLVKCATHVLSKKHIKESAKKTTIHENILHAYLEMLRNILTDSDGEFVERLIRQPYSVLFEQYRDLPPAMKLVFTKNSLIKMQAAYKARFPNKDFENQYVIHLLTLLMEFIEKDGNPHMRQRVIDIAQEINGMEYEDDQFEYIKQVITYYTAFVLDMYLLFRAYKQGKQRKLAVSYLGNAHCESIIHYLTQVIKTHRVEYETHGKGVVQFDQNIYLTHLPMDIGAKKRTKRVKIAKIAKRGTRVKRGAKRA